MKPKASALIVFNDGRHTTELMSTKNLLHKSHSNNEHRRKVSVGVLFSSKMLLTLRSNSISSLSALCLLQPYGLIAWLLETPSIFSTDGGHNSFWSSTEEGEADGRLRRV